MDMRPLFLCAVLALLLTACKGDIPSDTATDSEVPIVAPSLTMTQVYAPSGAACYQIWITPTDRVAVTCPIGGDDPRHLGVVYAFDAVSPPMDLDDAPIVVRGDPELDYIGTQLHSRAGTGQAWIGAYDADAASERSGIGYVLDIDTLSAGGHTIADVASITVPDVDGASLFGITGAWTGDQWVTQSQGNGDNNPGFYAVDPDGLAVPFGPADPCGVALTGCGNTIAFVGAEMWYSSQGGTIFRLAKGDTTPIAYQLHSGDLDPSDPDDALAGPSEGTRLTLLPSGLLFAGNYPYNGSPGEGAVLFDPADPSMQEDYDAGEGYGVSAAEGVTATGSGYRVIATQYDGEDGDAFGVLQIEYLTGGNAGTILVQPLDIEDSGCFAPIVAAHGAYIGVVCQHTTDYIGVGIVEG